MRIEGQTVFVPWYGKMLEGNIVRENGLMGLTAVRIPLQGQHPIALFTPGHVYDTPQEEQLGNSPQISPNSPQISPNSPQISPNFPQISPNFPKVSETSPSEAFRKSHWDHERNHLRIDALDEFYSLWKMEHAPSGYVKEAVAKIETKPIKRNIKAIQLSLFD